MLRQEQTPLKLSAIEATSVRQRVRTKRRQDFDFFVRVTFAGIEDGCRKQDRGAAFNDDTRAFPSIPARHDVSRRVDANFLADLVARHIVSMDDARQMMRALTYELAKKTYKLD
jgi:hypothetical protein